MGTSAARRGSLVCGDELNRVSRCRLMILRVCSRLQLYTHGEGAPVATRLLAINSQSIFYTPVVNEERGIYFTCIDIGVICQKGRGQRGDVGDKCLLRTEKVRRRIFMTVIKILSSSESFTNLKHLFTNNGTNR